MLTRRGFAVLASLVGLGTLVAGSELPRLIRRLGLLPALAGETLLARIEALVGRLDRGEISPETFVREVRARFDDTDLPGEFQPRLAAPPAGGGVTGIWSAKEQKRQRSLLLVFIPPGQATPAHAHHQVASTQCVVRGALHVRQYERVRRLDPHTLALRPVADRILQPRAAFLTTERLDNVHWFGAEAEPAVVVNYNLNGGFTHTFDPPGARPIGRYYVDPTAPARVDGCIAAPELSTDAAHERFAHHALSEFQSASVAG